MLNSYHVFAIIITVLLAYCLTFVLVKRGKLALIIHRRIWNYLLLVVFLASALLGLFLAIQIDYNLPLNWYRISLWLHVEFGIIMATISIFHIVWHSYYFFPKKRS
jgi:hypothetical protein